MVKLRRGKKDEAQPASAPQADAQTGEAEAGGEQSAVMVDAPPPAAPEPAAWEPPPAAYSGGSPSSSSSGRGGLFNRMYGDVGEQSADERDRQAAAEFQAVLAPAMDLLHASVPEASSPEEAGRILEQKAGEVELVPDPHGGAYVRGDAFDADARVYYRLLRRDYEKTPRPSEKNRRQPSPHLHQIYGKLTGNKGW